MPSIRQTTTVWETESSCRWATPWSRSLFIKNILWLHNDRT